MIFPFSLRNGYGKDLWPRPWTTVVLIVVVVVVVVVDVDDTVVVAVLGGEFSPKIRSIEKFNCEDLLIIGFDWDFCGTIGGLGFFGWIAGFGTG